jgi:branched-chain amino acid transport system substrate-binding protein
MNRRIIGLLAVATSIALVAGGIRPALSADPYEINIIAPLTGGGAFIAATQQKSMKVLEALVNKQGGVQGRPIHFTYLDDQTNPQVTVQLANGLIAKKTPIVLGSSLSGMCKAIAPLFAANGPLQYCLSPAIYPAKGSYVFTASVSTRDLLFATVRFFREKGWTKIAMLSTTDASGQDGDRDLGDALTFPENKGVTLVASEHYNPSDVSASAQVARIKSKGPQAIIIWAPGTPFGTALHAMNEIGLDIPIATTSANMVSAQLKGYASFAPKYLVGPGLTYAAGIATTPQVAAQQKIYFDALKDAGLQPNDVQAGLTWDAGLIVVDALKHIGPSATPEQLRDYISGLKDFAGITGVYNFVDVPQRGVTIADVVIQRWDFGKSQWVNVSKAGATL